MKRTALSKYWPYWGGTVFVFSMIFAAACLKNPGPQKEKTEKTLTVEVQLDKFRAKLGDSVQIYVTVRSAKNLRGLKVSASLFMPTGNVENLALRVLEPVGKHQAVFHSEVSLTKNRPEGFYGITVKAARGSLPSYGKGSFLLGKAVGDFFIVSAAPEQNQEEDIERYLRDFKSIGGNLVIIHNLISEKAWYPSRVCTKAARAGTPEDKVGAILKMAEKYGASCLLSVSWDMTQSIPYADYMKSMNSIMSELWEMYGSNPALIGFYDYQEGSGTYYASHIRDFAAAVKAQNKGLLTACAPYIDDPLLSGYLAAIDNLDIVIYQGAVMASFRPDNRKCFPLRRTKDCTGLSAGATLLKNKITLSHVELFGYLEKSFANAYLAAPDDIRGQIMSAAACYGPDGITFFSYHYNIHEMGKKIPEVTHSKRGVEEGMQAYQLMAKSAASVSSRIGLYIPYNDWWADRWTNCVVPALDAFRKLGLSPDIIPFIPPEGEGILPFYPYHLNEEQLRYLLSHNYVLALADIAGVQDTDSLLLKKFVEGGGAVLLFGPHIPYGDLFDREELCGGRENPASPHSWVQIQEPLWTTENRAKKGLRYPLTAANFRSWRPVKGRVLAAFEDGSGAVLWKKSGAGFVITIPLSLSDAVEIMPDYLREILDLARGQTGAPQAFDILGANENMDIAMALTNRGYQLAAINYQKTPVKLAIRPLHLKEGTSYQLTDLKTGCVIAERQGKYFSKIEMAVPALNYIVLSLSEK